MRISKVVFCLSALTAVLALVAAGSDLFWPGGDGTYTFTSVRGERVEIYGRGLYRNDTLFVGALNRGTDVAVLFVAIPFLVFALGWYRRGSLRGGLLLAGTLAYFVYVYASAALGATSYNALFLIYIALFSTSLFALVTLLMSIDPGELVACLSPRDPGRILAIFMLACGAVTTAVWLGMGLLPAIVGGEAPEHLDSYATPVTDALDLGIITPATFLVGYLLLRQAPLGYLLVTPLLGILVLLGPTFVAQTLSQSRAGISVSPGEIVGPIAGFGLLAGLAIWMMTTLLGNIAESKPELRATAQAENGKWILAANSRDPRSVMRSPALSARLVEERE
jgi:hypothetical protein